MRRVSALAAVMSALSAGGCCSYPDFSLPDFRGRLDFSGSLAVDIDFDADMMFDFDGDISGWVKLDVGTLGSLDLDISGKVAFEQELELDIDDDGVDETVSLIGFSDGDADDVDTVIASWEGDVYTFDEDYCYLLIVTEDTVTLMAGPCDSDSPVLTCVSPADDLDDVSCEVCNEDGQCAECESSKVSECIDEGEDALDELAETEEAETEEPEETEAEEPPMQSDAGMAPSTDAGVAAPSPSVPDAGGVMADDMDSGPETPVEEEPEMANTAEFDACVQQVSTLEASIALCGLSLSVEVDTLCSTSLSAVERCFSSIDGLSLFEDPCSVLQGDDCAGVVQ